MLVPIVDGGRASQHFVVKTSRSLTLLPADQLDALRFLDQFLTAKQIDRIAANQRADLYYELHPGSPSAVRFPKLSVRSGVWIALLGQSVRNGIAGFGPTIEAALRAFDT